MRCVLFLVSCLWFSTWFHFQLFCTKQLTFYCEIVITRSVQILCLMTFVVRYQLTLQCKISNNKSKSKGTAHLWSNVHGPTISSWCACLHVAVSVGVVVSQLLVDLVDEVVHLDGVVVIVLGWGPHINDVSRAERGWLNF